MTAFTDHSISLMEEIDRSAGGRLNMTRGGYALVTRRERPDDPRTVLSDDQSWLAA